MILSIVTSPGVSGRRNETEIVDAALAASPYEFDKILGVYGIKAAPCDRVGERWARKRGILTVIAQPDELPSSPAQRAEMIVANSDAVLVIGTAHDVGRLYHVRTAAKWMGVPCHWHLGTWSYDRWTDPA
jgi:hypothetical protein